ncbi:MAG: tetratricopeptide repeat protein [Bacteroidia bacterium]|nr:tetratricopeptide repeat protein [Bacteroidia bacterium]
MAFFTQSLYSQTLNSADSLRKLLVETKEDSTKINLYLKLGDVFEVDMPDSADTYYGIALGIAKNGSDNTCIAKCYNKQGLFYSNNGNYDLAHKAFNLQLKIVEIQNNLPEVASCYLNLGELFICQGNYPKSLDLFQKSIKIYERLIISKDPEISLSGKKGIIRSYNSIGRVHAENSNYDRANEYFRKALSVVEKIGDKRVIAGCYNNIGNVYYMKGDFSNAIVYYQKSLKVVEELNDKQGMSERYNNIGLVYADKGNNNLAISFYLKSLKIDEELGDKRGMAIVLGNISLLKIQLKEYKEAIVYAEKSLEIARKIGSLDEEKCAYGYLSAIYDSIGNYKKTTEYLKLFKLMNDSIFNLESARQVKEMEAVYQTEKKQKEIELLSKDKELQKAEISKQETQKIGFIIGFIFVLIFAVVIFRSYNNKKKANVLLTEQKRQIQEKNEELNQQNEEIAAQRDEIESQRDLVTLQKEKIEEIHTELTSSIHYAKRIQNAVLPNKEFTDTLLTDYFVLLKPRNIVSGDFYWLTIKKNLLFVAVADCTGHGVPGAFMSMLGISLLNEIVNTQEVSTASQLLNELRKHVLISLQQKGVLGEQSLSNPLVQDGMDISLICINLESVFSDKGEEKYSVQFSGANNSLYIISSSVSPSYSSKLDQGGVEGNEESTSLSNSNVMGVTHKLMELKGDKMPISMYKNMADFSNHEFTLVKGDTIYLCTDGFSDQFGGPCERKYLSKNFKKLLLENSHKAMKEQKTILNEAIETWINGYGKSFEQTDDITVMGIKI